jgi:hypothetical protein
MSECVKSVVVSEYAVVTDYCKERDAGVHRIVHFRAKVALGGENYTFVRLDIWHVFLVAHFSIEFLVWSYVLKGFSAQQASEVSHCGLHKCFI